jgi:C1A family cysteine protease
VKRQQLRLKNSWGEDYGDDGHALIAFDDFEELLRQEGEACLAIEQRPTARLAAAA